MRLVKVGLFIGVSLFTLSSFALTSLQLENLEGSFQSDQGRGQLRLLKIDNEPEYRNLSFKLIKESDQFRLQTQEREFLWEQAPNFLLELSQAKWRGVSAIYGSNSALVRVQSLAGENTSQALVLSQLEANCHGQSSGQDSLLRLIEMCTQKGKLSFNEISLREKFTFVKQLLTPLIKGLGLKSDIFSDKTKIEDLILTINGGKFDFKLKADVNIRVNIKGNGRLSFSQTQNGSQFKIRLDRVKASFLTVTDKVFDEIEKLNQPQVSVQRPFIIVDIP